MERRKMINMKHLIIVLTSIADYKLASQGLLKITAPFFDHQFHIPIILCQRQLVSYFFKWSNPNLHSYRTCL